MASSSAFKSPAYFLTLGLVAFTVCQLIGFFLLPRFFYNDLGISNYEVHLRTVFFYIIGFVTCAALFLRAAAALPKGTATCATMRKGLTAVACLFLLLMVVPDVKEDVVRCAHIAVGFALFIAEMALSLWFLARMHLSVLEKCVVLLEFLSLLVVLASLVHIFSWEAESQVVFEVAFMFLCIGVARRIAPTPT